MKRLLGFALLFAGIAAAQCNTAVIPDPRIWQGTYSAGATYAVCDVVYYAGSAYTSIQAANTAHQPDTSGAWWSVLYSAPVNLQPTTARAGSYLAIDYNNAWIRANSIGNVASVFGRTGPVTAQSGDYQASQVTNAVDSTVPVNNPAYISGLPWTKITGQPTIVPSVFGRVGAVTAQTGDYTAAQVTNAVDATQNYTNPPWLTSLPFTKISGVPSFEPALGNPSSSGYVLSSTSSGTRSWVAPNVGTVTSVTVAGTANQITASGCVITTSGTCTISLPSNLILPGKTTFAATTTASSSFNIPSGTAPSSPNNGDFWNISGILQFFDGTATRSILTDNSSLAWGKIAGVPTFLTPANNLSDLANTGTARTNLGLGTAATQASSAFEVPLTFSGFLSRSTNTVTLPVWGGGSRPVTANALGVSGNCVQWSAAGIGDTGSPCGTGSGTGANALGFYLVNQATNAPANAINLGILPTGLMKNTISGGVATQSTAVAGTDYEAPLGNPSSNGQVLASTTSGTRSWVNAGVGTVTSVTINGTSNQITVSGCGAITTSGTCNLSLPNNLILPGKLNLFAGSTSAASLNIASGVAPTSPASGDFWNLGTSLQWHDGTAVRTLLTDNSSLAWGKIAGAPTFLTPANNLSDVANATTARTNLGLGTAATQASSAFEVPLTFSGFLNRTSNTITLPVWGSGSRPVVANALGVSGNCVQWSAVGIGDTGSPCGSGGSGANALGSYWVSGSANAPANGVNIGALTAGLMKISISGGVATPSTAVSGTDYQAPITTGTVDQYLNGTLALTSRVNCIAAGGVLQYNTSTHAETCHTLASADIPNNAANTSGNAATATALAATPTPCSTGQAPTGILANGNSTGCASISGSGASFPTCHAYTYTTGTLTVDFSSFTCAVVTASGANPTLAFTPPSSSAATPLTLALINDTTARTWTLPGTAKQIAIPSAASTGVWNTSITYDGTNFQGSGSNETPSIIRFTAERSDPGTGNCGLGGCLFAESTTHNLWRRTSGDLLFKMFKSAVDTNPDTGQVIGLNGTPFCSGFTPTNGQAITLSTALSPNPCWTAVTPSGGSGTPAGASGTMQFNSSGSFGGKPMVYSSLHSGTAEYQQPENCWTATVNASEFNAAATSQQIAIGTVPANWSPRSVQIEESTSLSCNSTCVTNSGNAGMTQLSMSIGSASQPTYYVNSYLTGSTVAFKGDNAGGQPDGLTSHAVYLQASVSNINPGNLGSGTGSGYATAGQFKARVCGVVYQ